MIAFRVVSGESDVFVHVERLDVFEGEFALLIIFDELFVHSQRRAARRQTQHEVICRTRLVL